MFCIRLLKHHLQLIETYHIAYYRLIVSQKQQTCISGKRKTQIQQSIFCRKLRSICVCFIETTSFDQVVIPNGSAIGQLIASLNDSQQRVEAGNASQILHCQQNDDKTVQYWPSNPPRGHKLLLQSLFGNEK